MELPFQKNLQSFHAIKVRHTLKALQINEVFLVFVAILTKLYKGCIIKYRVKRFVLPEICTFFVERMVCDG